MQKQRENTVKIVCDSMYLDRVRYFYFYSRCPLYATFQVFLFFFFSVFRLCVSGDWQVLWLFGENHHVTEVGAMNIFFLLEKEGGGSLELVTCPLDKGDILDGTHVFAA